MKTILLPRAGIGRGSLILVNARYPCRAGADEPPLTPACPAAPNVLLEQQAAAALNRLMDELDGWRQITPVSGWRPRREQQAIYTQSLRDSGEVFTRRFVALPGCSEHQTGLAIDLALTRPVIDFICPDFPYTGICQNFRRRAADYGFVERYPKEKEEITGIAHEPWHFRYVGAPHAALMGRHGLALEEYIDFLRQYPASHPLCGPGYAVFFLPARAEGQTCLEVGEDQPCEVSGNNVDGFLVTVRGRP